VLLQYPNDLLSTRPVLLHASSSDYITEELQLPMEEIPGQLKRMMHICASVLALEADRSLGGGV
jgi:hypothetical protein